MKNPPTFAFLTAALTAAICCVSPAHADLVYNFTGEVTAVDMLLDSQFTVGDTFTFSFSIDETTADTNPDPENGSYPGMAAVILSYSNGYTAGAVGSPVLGVLNNGAELGDAFFAEFGATGGAVSGQMPNFIDFRLRDNTATAFTSDAIPTALDLNDFNVRRFSLFFNGSAGEPQVAGLITSVSVVPEPSSLAMLGLVGLVLLGVRRRHKITS